MHNHCGGRIVVEVCAKTCTQYFPMGVTVTIPETLSGAMLLKVFLKKKKEKTCVDVREQAMKGNI